MVFLARIAESCARAANDFAVSVAGCGGLLARPDRFEYPEPEKTPLPPKPASTKTQVDQDWVAISMDFAAVMGDLSRAFHKVKTGVERERPN